MGEPQLAVCWGAGVDSTAMLVEMERRGIRPTLITFADTGGEKNVPDPSRGEQIGTYSFIPVFSRWLQDHAFPAPLTCVYEPQPKTNQRYLAAAHEVVDRLGLQLGYADILGLSRLYGNMAANDTLPGIAFGSKSCSVKWKLEAQEPH